MPHNSAVKHQRTVEITTLLKLNLDLINYSNQHLDENMNISYHKSTSYLEPYNKIFNVLIQTTRCSVHQI